MGIDIPFTLHGGKKNKSFRLFNNEQLDMNYKLNNLSFLSLIDRITKTNQQQESYIKASNSKKYYEELKTKKSKNLEKKKKKKKKTLN